MEQFFSMKTALMTNPNGYYRFPTLSDDTIVFVSEDDLWSVPLDGGVARRLTSSLGRVSSPSLSRDGKWLAFSSTEEGHSEIYVMPSSGGEPRRLTHYGANTRVVGWNASGEVLFASNHQHAFARLTDIYSVDFESGQTKHVPCGPVTHYDCDSKNRVVIARNGGTDLAYWKRYKGGTAGQIWIDRKGNGHFERLLKTPHNTARPFLVGERVVYISDHEGIANVYSVNLDGTDERRLTNHQDFFVRGLNVSGRKLVYHAGGDLYFLELDAKGKVSTRSRKVKVVYGSPRTQASRRFVSAADHLMDFDLDPEGEKAVVEARGKTFSFDLWRGPVFMHGQEGPIRERLGRFLKDGKRIVLVSDAGGEEALEIHDHGERAKIERFTKLDLGRAKELKLSPCADEVAISNHRNELIWVDLTSKKTKVIDKSEYHQIWGFNWSHDGRYLAYSCSVDMRRIAIKIYDCKTGKSQQVTEPLLYDTRPVFDPNGEYLYFLSHREFDPVYDNMHFDLGFPRGVKPYLLTLKKETLPPWHPDYPGRNKDTKKDDKKNSKKDDKDAPKIEIDFDGIKQRIVAFPLPDGRYLQLAATKEKVFFTRQPIRGSISLDWHSPEASDISLETFDLETEKMETTVSNISWFRLSKDGKQLIYRTGSSLRVIRAGEKPPTTSDDYKRGGWLDLNRVQIPVSPRIEWKQMYREAWRLQRDHFWTEDMSKVDWLRVYTHYLPLIDRVGTRSEISDVIWEMQGELGTSHAYEIGGDYRWDPHYGVGLLGMDGAWDAKDDGYRLNRVLVGDPWDETCSSPLARAGVGLKAGDFLLSIDGVRLTREMQPCRALLHKAGRDVSITFRRQGAKKEETRSVRTLKSEQKLRYREWVEGNRRWVHEKSGGKVGYVHIPNMGPFGYAEFHRGFLLDVLRDGLIVDVRFNGGGHVSQLLLEKLARRRIGYNKSRWTGLQPFPDESPAGPMVALTNEHAGSDGDIFSHSFKMMKLGPLLGKRTWGGVIGISPSHSLVDGAITTQPEYSYWFADVGWKVENWGTDPDIEVEFPPDAYVKGTDPQLDAALKACQKEMEEKPILRPSAVGELPDLRLPWKEE